MKTRRILFCAGTLIALSGGAQTQVINLSTGVNNSTGALLAIASADDTWQVKVPGSGTFQTAYVSDGRVSQGNTIYPNAWGQNGCGRWISPYTITGAIPTFGTVPGSPNIAGNFIYRTTFYTSECAFASATLTLNVAGADNSLTNVSINGNNHSLSGIGFNPLSTNYAVTVSTSEFVGGTNVIEFTVNNSNYYTGFFLCGSLSVTGKSNSPDFSLSTNKNPGDNFYTATAVPTNKNTSGIPGYGYAWNVEEIVSPSDHTVLSGSESGNSPCWWTGISPILNNSFNGYHGPYFTVTGHNPMDFGGCSNPSVGIFNAGHTYRVVRGTWGTYCPWSQYAVIMYMSAGLVDGENSISIVEDLDAPDFSHLMKTTTSITDVEKSSIPFTVYPNPGNGKFNVHVSDKQVKGAIEVYDMQGNLIQHVDIDQATDYLLDLSNYSKGIYMVNMIAGNKKYAEKIIIK